MAAARFTGPIEPMDLANMRRNGVRSLVVQCRQCLHELIMNVDHLPGDFTVPSLGPKMVCTKCGTIGADARPNWRKRSNEAPVGQQAIPARKQAAQVGYLSHQGDAGGPAWAR
jgi:hypothetical protein